MRYFIVNLIREVFGAAGAVWGSSDGKLASRGALVEG